MPNPVRDPQFDLLALLAEPEYRRGPHALLRTLRETDPIHRTSAGFYVLSRHADASRMLRASGQDLRGATNPTPHLSLALQRNSLPSLDPPVHGKLRGAIVGEFTQRRLENQPARIEAISDRLAGALAERLRANEIVDLHATFSLPLSVAAIADVVGIPEPDRDWLVHTVSAVAMVFDGAAETQLTAASTHAAHLRDYLLDLINQRRHHPRDDLVSTLASNRRLADEEIVGTLWAVWTGAMLPVACGLNQAILTMLRHPGHTDWLGRDLAAAQAFVAEALRWDGFVLFTAYPRIAQRDLHLGDVTIPAGSDVRSMLAAADRDPDTFPEPTRFDPHRDPRASLAFGAGRHICLAADLARTEIAIAIARLHRHVPTFAAHTEPTWLTPVRVRVMREFPVTLT